MTWILWVAVACETPSEGDNGQSLLARHVFTDFYDAYPGIPSPQGDRVFFSDYAAETRSIVVYDVATGMHRQLKTSVDARA